MTTDHLKKEGEVKTVFDCTECSKQIIALVNFDLDGNHIIACPHCGHEHCRVIKAGVITGDRWSSRPGGQKAHKPRRVWKHNAAPIEASSASEFIRQRWIDRYHS